MIACVHKVQYYETDKMGITHHSNYIRWMEEGRTHYLEAVGMPYDELEKMGLVSPVLSLDCNYREPTTYGDEVEIGVGIREYNGFRVKFIYTMRNAGTGKTVFTATSDHCFLSKDGGIVRFSRAYPALHERFLALVESGE